jgi:hypothetical protein
MPEICRFYGIVIKMYLAAFFMVFPLSLVRWNNGVTTEIVRAGDPTPVGGTFTYFYCLPDTQDALNNNGDLVFAASYVTANGVGSGGIFVGDGLTTRAIAVLGDPTPIGGTFRTLVFPSRS